MDFKIIGSIHDIETIAIGHGIRNLNRLKKVLWKTILDAEVHWYEGHGIGKKRMERL